MLTSLHGDILEEMMSHLRDSPLVRVNRKLVDRGALSYATCRVAQTPESSVDGKANLSEEVGLRASWTGVCWRTQPGLIQEPRISGQSTGLCQVQNTHKTSNQLKNGGNPPICKSKSLQIEVPVPWQHRVAGHPSLKLAMPGCRMPPVRLHLCAACCANA